MKTLLTTLCLTIAVLLGSVDTTRAKGFGEFICQNFQTLNINDAGEVVDENLVTETYSNKIVITKRKVEMTYPAQGGAVVTKSLYLGKWTTSEKGTQKFLVDETKEGFALTKIEWTKYGLGTFRNYGVNRHRVSLFKCMKVK